MIYLHDDREEKKLSVFIFNDEIGFTRDNPYVKDQIESFVERGYQVHHYIYPEVHNLPAEVQELYNSMYINKACLEKFVDVTSYAFVQQLLVEVVKQELSKYTLDDILETIAHFIVHNKDKV